MRTRKGEDCQAEKVRLGTLRKGDNVRREGFRDMRNKRIEKRREEKRGEEERRKTER